MFAQNKSTCTHTHTWLLEPCICPVCLTTCLLIAVALLSMQAQIQAGTTNNKPVQLLQYGPEGPVDPTKCTAVCFIPGSEGTVFAAAHLSGTVIIHIKVNDHCPIQ